MSIDKKIKLCTRGAQVCMPQSSLALKAFAACIDDQPNTPCLKDMDLPSHCLLCGKSISLTQGVLGRAKY